MEMMDTTDDFLVTDSFVESYDALDDNTVALVDEAIERLLTNHTSAWARQGRVAGEHGEAWILEIHTKRADLSLYWDYVDDRLIILLLLLVRPA